jgi:hypothetical protein
MRAGRVAPPERETEMKLTPFAWSVAMGLALMSAMAFAQTEPGTTVVTAEPWVATFLPFITTLTTGLIGLLTIFLGYYLKAKYDIDWEKENRDAFQTSATNAAGLFIQRVGAEAAMATIDVHDPRLKEFIDYVGKGAPKAIEQWGITPERVAKTILAKVAQVLPVEVAPIAGPLPTPIRDEATGRYTR